MSHFFLSIWLSRFNSIDSTDFAFRKYPFTSESTALRCDISALIPFSATCYLSFSAIANTMRLLYFIRSADKASLIYTWFSHLVEYGFLVKWPVFVQTHFIEKKKIESSIFYNIGRTSLILLFLYSKYSRTMSYRKNFYCCIYLS